MTRTRIKPRRINYLDVQFRRPQMGGMSYELSMHYVNMYEHICVLYYVVNDMNYRRPMCHPSYEYTYSSEWIVLNITKYCQSI